MPSNNCTKERKYTPSNGSVPLAVTFLATVLEPVLKVPVKGFALVTDPTRHVLFTGAKASLRNRVTAALGKKVLSHTVGITVALFTKWVVVPGKKCFYLLNLKTCL